MNRHCGHYNVLVIGGGIIGSAVLDAVSSIGLSVAVFEKGRISSGSTGKSGGFVRVYHDNNAQTELAALSHDSFINAGQGGGISCDFHRTGALHIKPISIIDEAEKRIEFIKKINQNYSIEIKNADKCRRDFPQLHWPDNEEVFGIYESDAGYADPILMTHELARHGVNKGAALFEGVEVFDFVITQNQVTGLITSQGMVSGDYVVVAAGVWSRDLLLSIGVELELRSKVIETFFFSNKNKQPSSIIMDDTSLPFYSRPCQGDMTLVGVAKDEWDIDPDKLNQAVGDPDDALVAAASRLPWIHDITQMRGGRRGFDAFVPNETGLLEISDKYNNLLFATGWSGGGFKIALAAAQRVVEMLNH